MRKNKLILRLFCLATISCVYSFSDAQDKIYTTDGQVMEGKVSEIGIRQIKYTRSDIPDGPVYIMDKRDIDSVVYPNSKVDYMQGYLRKRGLLNNIPQLNTWTFDLLGFTYLSVSQSYERGVTPRMIGLRVPLYIGFLGGGIAGVGTFLPGQGVYYAQNSNSNYGGFSIATGLNPKFYMFRRRIVRAFAGPEVTIGYSATPPGSNYNYNNNSIYYYNATNYQADHYGTITAIGKVGLSLNPKDKFNITIDGGAGIGNQFGKYNPIGWTGLWHIGLSLGTNF